MSKEVKGFLAADGTFFEHEAECNRYEAMRELEGLCETHEINFENFIATINAWCNPIRDYFDADNKCQTHQVGKELKLDGRDTIDDIPSFLRSERYPANSASGDKDAKGFLEQQIRRRE